MNTSTTRVISVNHHNRLILFIDTRQHKLKIVFASCNYFSFPSTNKTEIKKRVSNKYFESEIRKIHFFFFELLGDFET